MITVLLQPYDTLSGILGSFCQYFDNTTQKNMAILESGKVASWKNGEKQPEETVLFYSINSKDPIKKLIYDETSNKPQDLHLKMQHDFWMNHPDVHSMNGYVNPNADKMSKPRYLIINMDEKKAGETADIEMKSKAITKFLAMGAVGRKRAAIFYAMPGAVTAEDGDIIIALGDLTKGMLTTKGEFMFGGVKYTYIDHFVNEYQDKSEDTDLVININKAIDKGLIVAQLQSGTHLLDCFLFKNVPIATSKDQLIAYFKNNKNETEFIINQVASAKAEPLVGEEERTLRAKAIKLKVAAQDKYPFEKLKIEVDAIESGEKKKLQEEATKAGIKYHPAISYLKLKEKVAAAKEPA